MNARTPGALSGNPPRQGKPGRTCARCDRKLSRYNLESICGACEMKKWKSTKYPDGCIACPPEERFDRAFMGRGLCTTHYFQDRAGKETIPANGTPGPGEDPLPEPPPVEYVTHLDPDSGEVDSIEPAEDVDEDTYPPETNGHPVTIDELDHATGAIGFDVSGTHTRPRGYEPDSRMLAGASAAECCGMPGGCEQSWCPNDAEPDPEDDSEEFEPIVVYGDDEPAAPAHSTERKFTMPGWLFLLILFQLLGVAFFAGVRRGRG